jgi:hypothetical protein
MDRFNRIFLRTLRALQDLRRRTPTVIVQNVGQVKIGEQQTSPRNGDAHSDGTPRPCTCPTDRGSLVTESL